MSAAPLTVEAADLQLPPLFCLTVVSVTVNVIGACGWLLETVRSWKLSRAAASTATVDRDRFRMYTVVNLVLSQALALYAMALLLRLPLLDHSFLYPSEVVMRYTMPAISVAVGRHIFFCFFSIDTNGSPVHSLFHAVSALCHLLFLLTPCTLVLAPLALLTEIGTIHTQLMAVVGERRAGPLPCWVAGLGVLLAVSFSGLLYLLVLALALARRSPLTMPPAAVTVFFFYTTYSFIMNTYSIYLVAASFYNSVVEAHVRRLMASHGLVGTSVSAQTLSKLYAALSPRAGSWRRQEPAAPLQLKCFDHTSLVNNMA